MRNTSAIAFSFLLLTTVAAAQIPTSGNVFIGYSYARADVLANTNPVLFASDRANLNGWEGSLEGKFLPWVGLVTDFSGHYGTQNFSVGCEAIPSPPCFPTTSHVDVKVYSFLFGPRVSVSLGKVTPFAHALFGAAHANASGVGFSGSDTSFATAVGGGLDYKLIPAVAWRFQGDLLQTRFFSDTQNDLRLSTGLVLRF